MRNGWVLFLGRGRLRVWTMIPTLSAVLLLVVGSAIGSEKSVVEPGDAAGNGKALEKERSPEIEAVGSENADGARTAKGPEGLAVELNRSTFVPGDVVEITLVNEREGAVFLPGCPQFRLEVFEDERFGPVRSPDCKAEGVAISYAAGRHSLEHRPRPEDAGSIFRVVVTLGEKCREGRALSRARCESFVTVRSRSFRVGEATGAN